MRSLRIAVVGLGGVANNAHLPVIAARDDVELVAAADPSPRALARHPNMLHFTGVPELLGGASFDAVLVLAPEQLHAQIVRPFLERGIAVFCEKPLAPSLAEAQELHDLAECTGTTLMVGFNRRFAPVYVKAKAALIDRPASVGVFEKAKSERGFRGSVENLIHMVDLARFFFGECLEVAAHADYDDPYREESLSAMLRFEGGRVATVIGNRSTGVWTERVAFHGGGQTVTVHAPDEVTVAVGGEERTVRQTPAASGFTSAAVSLGFADQAEHFFSAVRRGAPVTQNDATSALRTQELMDRILRVAGLPVEDTRANASSDDAVA